MPKQLEKIENCKTNSRKSLRSTANITHTNRVDLGPLSSTGVRRGHVCCEALRLAPAESAYRRVDCQL
jgi:hypothetical protein